MRHTEKGIEWDKLAEARSGQPVHLSDVLDDAMRAFIASLDSYALADLDEARSTAQ